MKSTSLKAFAALLAAVLAALPLAAQGRRGGSASPAILNPPTLLTVEGSVSSVDLQYGEGYPNFGLSAADGVKYVIFVGPLRYLDDNDFELSVGDSLRASIFPDPQSGNVYVAAVLTNLATGQTLTLRDASGLPLWIRRGNSSHAGFGGGGPARATGEGPSVRQGQGPTALRAGQPSIDLSTLATYSGTVTKVNIAAGEAHPTIEVLLSSGGTAVFCLGPYRYLDQIGLEIQAGDAVTIKAADCAQDPDEFVVFEITVGGNAYLIRNADGAPLWYFGRRR